MNKRKNALLNEVRRRELCRFLRQSLGVDRCAGARVRDQIPLDGEGFLTSRVHSFPLEHCLQWQTGQHHAATLINPCVVRSNSTQYISVITCRLYSSTLWLFKSFARALSNSSARK